MAFAILDHVHICSADPAASIAFYRAHFGALRAGGFADAHGGVNRFLVLGGKVLVIGDFPPGITSRPAPEPVDAAPACGYGVSHIGMNVVGLDGIVERLESAGYSITTRPVSVGFLKYAYVAGPDGVLLELTEYHPVGAAGVLRFVEPIVRLFARFSSWTMVMNLKFLAGRFWISSAGISSARTSNTATNNQSA